jgi:hypothetical protein
MKELVPAPVKKLGLAAGPVKASKLPTYIWFLEIGGGQGTIR